MSWSSILGLAVPIVTWLMKRAGVREEAQAVFVAAVKAAQAGPESTTAAADEERAAIDRLKAKLEAERAGPKA